MLIRGVCLNWFLRADRVICLEFCLLTVRMIGLGSPRFVRTIPFAIECRSQHRHHGTASAENNERWKCKYKWDRWVRNATTHIVTQCRDRSRRDLIRMAEGDKSSRTKRACFLAG